mmetsp:Transcript_15873/g.35743  ORF Transcript_15873/g.35743 Transcript_15873/m.35743 type:complete len:118 (-) Transcript_15873:699-1052(-)
MSAQPLIAIYSNSKMLDKIVSFSVHSIVVLFRSTFSYRNYLSGRTKISARLLNLFYDVDTIRDLSEHAVLPIKPWCFAGANKELATICVGAGICHRESSHPPMYNIKVFILESPTIN